MMTTEQIVDALIAKFGENEEVSTKDMIKHITDLGLDSSDYYNELRIKYGVRRGYLKFNRSTVRETYENDSIVPQIDEETEEEIATRINERFEALEIMSVATAKGINRSLILSGPAGIGKSFTVEKAAEEICGEFTHLKGYIRPTGLFRALWENRRKGKLIVCDDLDSIFADENSLNLLKAACDSSKIRKISWLSQAEIEDESGDVIPRTFEFEGSIIFITNIDFAAACEKGSKLSPHYEALMSRSHFLNLGIKNKRDYMVRIKQVIFTNMLPELSDEEKTEIVDFMNENIDKMRELSLRMCKKLADLMMMDKKSWKKLAKITCMK